jgi:DNA-binding GntR family transcriptional regulator
MNAFSNSIQDQIYARLRRDILDGVYQPGQTLRQEEMARQSNASRVPLREALARLEAEGLIVRRPRRGYAVALLDHADIVEIFELRMVLEEHAGYLAARSRTAEDVETVRELLVRMEGADHTHEGAFARWSLTNYRFHNRIIESSRRPRLCRIALSLRDSVEAYVRLEAAMTGEVRDAESEHRQIFDAFRAGDANGLAKLSRQHVAGTASRLLDGLRKAGHRDVTDTFAPLHRVMGKVARNATPDGALASPQAATPALEPIALSAKPR